MLLMFAYLSIKADMQRDDDNGVGERARSTESARQSAEQAAWSTMNER